MVAAAITRKSTSNSPITAPGPKRTKALQNAAQDGKVKRKRTKQGCITCRVRGKKCDETRNPDGTCGTCKRLRLHCLGFVDRRPEWLKSKENIKEWRKRVTDFLLSQGLVKGHAGCGLRPLTTPERQLTLDEMKRGMGTEGGNGDEDHLPDSLYNDFGDEDSNSPTSTPNFGQPRGYYSHSRSQSFGTASHTSQLNGSTLQPTSRLSLPHLSLHPTSPSLPPIAHFQPSIFQASNDAGEYPLRLATIQSLTPNDISPSSNPARSPRNGYFDQPPSSGSHQHNDSGSSYWSQGPTPVSASLSNGFLSVLSRAGSERSSDSPPGYPSSPLPSIGPLAVSDGYDQLLKAPGSDALPPSAYSPQPTPYSSLPLTYSGLPSLPPSYGQPVGLGVSQLGTYITAFY